MSFALTYSTSHSHMSSRHLPYLTANTIHCIIANQINKKTLDSHDSSLVNSITKPNLYPLKSSSCTTRSASINMTKRTPMLHTRSLPPPIICPFDICHIPTADRAYGIIANRVDDGISLQYPRRLGDCGCCLRKQCANTCTLSTSM
jgi:hypothetical protein